MTNLNVSQDETYSVVKNRGASLRTPIGIISSSNLSTMRNIHNMNVNKSPSTVKMGTL